MRGAAPVVFNVILAFNRNKRTASIVSNIIIYRHRLTFDNQNYIAKILAKKSMGALWLQDNSLVLVFAVNK